MVSPNCHNFKNPSFFPNCHGAMVHNFNLDLFHKFKAKSLFSHKKATRMLVLEMHPYVEMNLHSKGLVPFTEVVKVRGVTSF